MKSLALKIKLKLKRKIILKYKKQVYKRNKFICQKHNFLKPKNLSKSNKLKESSQFRHIILSIYQNLNKINLIIILEGTENNSVLSSSKITFLYKEFKS